MASTGVSASALIDLLVAETAQQAAFNVDHLRDQIKIRRRDGDPNWDALIVGASAPVAAAFGRALIKLTPLVYLIEE